MIPSQNVKTSTQSIYETEAKEGSMRQGHFSHALTKSQTDSEDPQTSIYQSETQIAPKRQKHEVSGQHVKTLQ